MSTPQLALLRAIQRRQGQPLSRLAEEMVMDRTSLYRAIALLVRSGWVRIEDAAAGRAKLVYLTDQGGEAAALAAPRWEAAQAQVILAFGVERWRELSQSIKALADLGVELAP
jgi:DNA-binding MarR family transcriptional regulator